MTENLTIKKEIASPQWENVEVGQLINVQNDSVAHICLMTGGRRVISLDCPSNFWLYPSYPKLLHIYPRGTKITYIS